MDGGQIDLLIDRDDRIIDLCEIKWATTEFIVTKAYADELRMKVALFKHYSNIKKKVFLTSSTLTAYFKTNTVWASMTKN